MFKNPNSELKIYTDGGSRGNPGYAAYGFVIYDSNGSKLYKEGKTIGKTTNNVAEYSAVIAALKYVLSSKHHVPGINFFMDSKLVAEQLSERWKIKNERLRNLYFTIKELEQNLGSKVIYEHVRREQNQEADSLVNAALDNRT